MTKLYAGPDVSLETMSVGVVDAEGHVRLETKVGTDTEALVRTLMGLEEPNDRVGLDAGPLSQ